MTPIYTLNQVEQRYDGRTVLKIPDLQIQTGELLALVGPSGAGKSTLLRLLAMLEPPTSGQVHLHHEGRTLTYQTASTGAKRQLAMVFQRPVMMSRSVRANVAYGLKLRGAKQIREKVEAVLRQVSMADLADARPQTLSGGELQRISIARAMILQPRVLLLDEPTANLDPYNIQLIEEFLRTEQARLGTTVIMVTHNIFQARRLADRVGFLYAGDLVEVAETDTFFNAPRDPRTAAFIDGRLIY